MTNQEAFNTVWDHFVVNKGPRSWAFSSCYYRGPNGSKCAVGVLIPDNVDMSKWENKSAGDLPEGVRPAGVGVNLLTSLQLAHDYASTDNFTKEIEIRLRDVASGYGLLIPT